MALNAARSVPLVHGIQPSAQAAVWYKHVHEMWKVFLHGLRALSAFVATYGNCFEWEYELMAVVLIVTIALGAGTVAYVFGYPVQSTIEKTSQAPT